VMTHLIRQKVVVPVEAQEMKEIVTLVVPMVLISLSDKAETERMLTARRKARCVIVRRRFF
jgi:hypothetical protein